MIFHFLRRHTSELSACGAYSEGFAGKIVEQFPSRLVPSALSMCVWQAVVRSTTNCSVFNSVGAKAIQDANDSWDGGACCTDENLLKVYSEARLRSEQKHQGSNSRGQRAETSPASKSQAINGDRGQGARLMHLIRHGIPIESVAALKRPDRRCI